MSVWLAPATFVSGAALTAAQLNATRDNLTFLKGFGDLITAGTTADTGTATYLSITRASSTDTAFRALVTGDTVSRLAALASGKLEWSTGAATSDTSFSRYGTSQMVLTGPSTAETGLALANGNGTILMSLTADTVGRLQYTNLTDLTVGPAMVAFTERSDMAGVADIARVYARDNGAGKTQLCVIFGSGTVQVIATQP